MEVLVKVSGKILFDWLRKSGALRVPSALHCVQQLVWIRRFGGDSFFYIELKCFKWFKDVEVSQFYRFVYVNNVALYCIDVFVLNHLIRFGNVE